jgi:hypothetical protein
VLLLFGALMSFSTRSVAENFNESKSIAFSIYNVLFTLCLVIAIGLLQQGDGRTLYLLVIFTLFWIAMCTFGITFAPKVITIYKDASGLIAHRISDSKASASELSRTPGPRTIKELSQQPIRLMDRVALRTYFVLLEREISLVRAALATMDANEGLLAHGGTSANQYVRNDSKNGGGTGTPPGPAGRTIGGVGGGHGSPRNSIVGLPGQPLPSPGTSHPTPVGGNSNGGSFGRAGTMYKYAQGSKVGPEISMGRESSQVRSGTSNGDRPPAGVTSRETIWEGKTTTTVRDAAYHGPTTAQLLAQKAAAAAEAAATGMASIRSNDSSDNAFSRSHTAMQLSIAHQTQSPNANGRPLDAPPTVRESTPNTYTTSSNTNTSASSNNGGGGYITTTISTNNNNNNTNNGAASTRFRMPSPSLQPQSTRLMSPPNGNSALTASSAAAAVVGHATSHGGDRNSLGANGINGMIVNTTTANGNASSRAMSPLTIATGLLPHRTYSSHSPPISHANLVMAPSLDDPNPPMIPISQSTPRA